VVNALTSVQNLRVDPGAVRTKLHTQLTTLTDIECWRTRPSQLSIEPNVTYKKERYGKEVKSVSSNSFLVPLARRHSKPMNITARRITQHYTVYFVTRCINRPKLLKLVSFCWHLADVNIVECTILPDMTFFVPFLV
jgi:hypothetical protein